ncbi:c-type cytochrome [Crateriforma conspicua]|uniref:Cytochrome c-552 n=1 Tax=Crateriforma conspicua TaxID=2527996 RepID=A0A5C6FIW2_9PLAN|nr:c-type cytochrome [Crateriforma conspicua]TWU62185.1 Cytochrome c-552 precursor [Crateriforma conspicua]
MKITFKRFLIATVTLGIIGVAVLVSGIVPVKASSGHWPVTAWFLDYASDRSVDFHSNGIEVPNLDVPGMITLGAGTYQTNCQFCHGQPERQQPPVAQGMTPTPPQLQDSLPEMSDQETFYIVKHGIKFAGMPAWPTQRRDDEIWPVVAFLNAMPSMTNEEYRQRTRRRPSDPPEGSFNRAEPIGDNAFIDEHCAACHGRDGSNNINRRVPILAGQNEAYLAMSLRSYRAMRRHSGVMMPVAYRLTDDRIDALAKHFSSQSRLPPKEPAPKSELVETGRRLATEGDVKKKIPSCVDCHGPGERLRSKTYPRLAGQPAWYIERQLELFGKRDRGGMKAKIMHKIADKLDDESRRAVAAYYAAAPAASL